MYSTHTADLDDSVYAGISELIARIAHGARVLAIAPLGSDSSAGGGTAKAKGYGAALLVTVTNPEAGGAPSKLVFHTAASDEFGHDRRADRAASAVLAYDTYSSIPGHVRALDVGTVGADGHLVSLRGAGEFYVVTEYAEGTIYAEDLRRIARRGHVITLDTDRCDALAHHLASLHAERIAHPSAYTRSIRDLVGHGEGIYGIIDGYPPDVPAAPPLRLQAIERRCADYRWRLRGRERRLSRIHGDFHPFNVVFDARKLTLLDTSRGSAGDPADDVACMAMNYVFFALETPTAWPRGFGVLWRSAAIVPPHGYTPAERDSFYLTLARLAALLAGQGLVVLVAATSHRRAHREQARAQAPQLIEVYVRVPLEECERRDPKGLYAAARAGALSGLPGADVAYEAPTAPDVIANGGDDPEAVVQILHKLAL